MNDDAVLLQQYVSSRSERAFASLVQRYVDLVYSAALRRTGGDAHSAADVSQIVFAKLAREADKLVRHPVLLGWLHTATRNAALNLMISEQRRKNRERATVELAPAEPDGASASWGTVRPVIDEVVDALPEADRDAVLLRFFEQRSFAEIGAALKISQDAARMRTERALERLRQLLAKRGITSTAVALGQVMASHSVLSAPAGLAAQLAAGVGAASAGVAAGAAIGTFMSTKAVVTAVMVTASAFIGGAYFGMSRAALEPLPPKPELPEHSKMIGAMRKENERLKGENERLRADNAKLAAAPRAAVSPPVAPTPLSADERAARVATIEIATKQRSIMNNLRQLAAARDQFMLEKGRAPTSIHELVGPEPDKYIRALIPADGEDYSGVALQRDQPMSITSPSGWTVTYDRAGGQPTGVETASPAPNMAEVARQLSIDPGPLTRAYEAFLAARPGTKPSSPYALLPFFSTPQEAADFVEAFESQPTQRKQR